MSARTRLARGLLRLGAYVQSLAVVVMRPDDLVEFSRQSYARPKNIQGWVEESLVDSGLSDDEKELVSALPATKGALLLLGVGGGREAVPLARLGFQVTGVDYVAAMVDCAAENAARRGVTIGGLVQEISRLDVPAGAYDVVWLSRGLYSCVPTRARRVEMVRRIARALKPGGLFLCQFHWCAGPRPPGKNLMARRIVAACTMGNLSYEPGDMLWGNAEFVHAFSSRETVKSEIEEGGLSVVSVLTDRTPTRGGAVCVKARSAEGVRDTERV